MADRYFHPFPLNSGVITLADEEAKHLVRVARKQVGDVVEIFNGDGSGTRAQILSTEKNAVTLQIQDAIPGRDPKADCTIAVSIPKGERLDWLVEKLTEIGVSRLVPLRCERSVVDPRTTKLERLRRVIIESCKQCGRNRLMTLAEPVGLADYLRSAPTAHQWIAHEGGLPFSQWPEITANQSVAIAIGPEGGWTAKELELAQSTGWTSIGLGVTRLRVETAAIVGASLALAAKLGSL